jgi:hypothetical protein
MSDESKLPLCLDDVPLPSELPPIVITAFTRPDLLEPVLKGITKQSLFPPKIIAFIDGLRKSSDESPRNDCINLLKEFNNTVPVEIIVRDRNLGCDGNVLISFTEVLQNNWALVYLEDDDIPNPCFYDRMCRLLVAYKDYPQVFSIGAHANVPKEVMGKISADFMISNRVFSWGFGVWADRWEKAALGLKPYPFNPFGKFYNIPLNKQTKHTLINQFWLERNQGSDWMISYSLAALYHGGIHITPMESFTHNIGCGHTESKTYKGGEGWWVNTSYNPDYYPNILPDSLELPELLNIPFDGIEAVNFFKKYQEMWISPRALIFFLKRYKKINEHLAIIKLFFDRLPLLLNRWREGLPIY